MKNKSLSVIIPAYNEDPIILDVIKKACKNVGLKTIIIDDGSDYPVKEADIRWEINRGQGSAIKAGVRKAKTTHVAFLDADGQYDVIDLIYMWEGMQDEDQLLGKRVCHQGTYKRLFGRLFLKLMACLFTMRYVKDLNTGLRIMDRKLALAYESLICDEFSYSSSYTLCFLLDGLKVKWVPIGFYPRQGSKSTVKMVRHGLIALYTIFRITFALRTRGLRKWLRER